MADYCSAPTATATRYRSSTLATNERTATVSVGKRPFGITIDAAGMRAYTANVASDDVSVIDIAAGKVDRHRAGRPPPLRRGARRGSMPSSPTSMPAR